MADTQMVVILAVDDSEHSDYAFHYYVDHIHRPGSFLYVVTSPEFQMAASDYEMSPGHIDSSLQQETAKADVLRTKYLNKMAECGVTGEFVVLQDTKTGHAVVDFSKTKDAKLVVTGSRGLGMVRRTIMGSVSDYIMHHSHVPVLVCRHKKHFEVPHSAE